MDLPLLWAPLICSVSTFVLFLPLLSLDEIEGFDLILAIIITLVMAIWTLRIPIQALGLMWESSWYADQMTLELLGANILVSLITMLLAGLIGAVRRAMRTDKASKSDSKGK